MDCMKQVIRRADAVGLVGFHGDRIGLSSFSMSVDDVDGCSTKILGMRRNLIREGDRPAQSFSSVAVALLDRDKVTLIW